MKFSFRKVSAIAMSTVLTGMSLGIAAAAAFPTDFTSATPAIVYGASADPMDLAQANKINTYLESKVPGVANTPAGSWKVGTSSDKLEIGESIKDVESYIDSSELPILADGSVTNSKGTATYKQYLYFEDAGSSLVNYTEDDDDNVGLFFKIDSGRPIARYVVDFTTAFKSDDPAGVLDDIRDKEITLLGKTYTITTATNSSTGVKLDLMSGAEKRTIQSGEELTVGGYTVSAVVSASNEVKFTVNGNTLSKMAESDIEKITGTNDYIAVTDISYESYSGGLHQATFWVGADKIVLKNGSSLEVNGNTISAAGNVTIASTGDSSTVSISEININMTAEDTLYVPVGGKLSTATDLDEPEVLFTQNWDIVFSGTTAVDKEEVTLKSSEGDKQYNLAFTNADGYKVDVPIAYSNSSGIYLGDEITKKLIIGANGTSAGNASLNDTITKNDYFILNSANPVTASSNVKSYVIQYKGADKTGDTDPKVRFKILGGDDDVEMTMATTILAETGPLATLKLGGTSFVFTNATQCTTTSDCEIRLVGPDYALREEVGAAVAMNRTVGYLRTYNNALISINTTTNNETSAGTAGLIVNLTVDDTNRDDDDLTLGENVFRLVLKNDSNGEIGSSGTSALWLSDTDNSDRSTYITRYGAEIEDIDTSSAPAQLTVKIPKNIVEPLVYVTSGAVAGSAGSMVFKDSEKSSWEAKNVVIVGGSCINTAAATALGVPSGTCGAAFTSATGVGANQYLIQSVADKFTSGKIALVVAGYDKEDTVAATTKLINNPTDIDTTAGNKYVGVVSVEGTSTISKV